MIDEAISNRITEIYWQVLLFRIEVKISINVVGYYALIVGIFT